MAPGPPRRIGNARCPGTGWASRSTRSTTHPRIVLAGGLTPDNVAEAIDLVAPIGRGRVVGRRVVAGHEGSRAHPRVRRRGCARIRGSSRNEHPLQPSDRFGSFGGRVRARDAHSGARRARGRLRRRAATTRRSATSCRHAVDYVGRPSPLSEAPRLSEHVGARVLLKREDLNHTGAHKINNTVGQVLLARRMGKQRIIAETGAGQHGVATATVCARFGLECVVYMGEEDMRRQALNVFRMRLMGAKVVPVTSGTRTLKDATTRGDPRLGHERQRTRTTSSARSSGPAPYPRMVRDFQAVIGVEARAQMLERTGRLPRTRRRVRRRRIERDGSLPRLRAGRRRGARRRRGGGRRARDANATPRRCRAGRRACCTAR